MDEFKNRLDSIYLSTSSSSKLYSMQDNLKQIILNELIWEDEERMQTKICRMILILMTDHALYLKLEHDISIQGKFTLMLQR